MSLHFLSHPSPAHGFRDHLPIGCFPSPSPVILSISCGFPASSCTELTGCPPTCPSMNHQLPLLGMLLLLLYSRPLSRTLSHSLPLDPALVSSAILTLLCLSQYTIHSQTAKGTAFPTDLPPSIPTASPLLSSLAWKITTAACLTGLNASNVVPGGRHIVETIAFLKRSICPYSSLD